MNQVKSTQDPIGIWPADLVFDPVSTLNVDPNEIDLSQKNAQLDTCRAIINAIGGVTVRGPRDGVRWRGQGSLSHRVESTATRRGIHGQELVNHEREMLDTARRLGMDNAQHLGDWEILARLRHSGATNRLIDVTTDPFVALYMLCDPTEHAQSREQDGALVAVTMTSLTKIKRPWDLESYNEMIQKGDRVALLFSTPPIDPRIAAQRGAFILSSDPVPASEEPTNELMSAEKPPSWTKQNLDRMCGTDLILGKRGRRQERFPKLFAIRIPWQAKQPLTEMLENHFGYTRETIYPDWAGLANSFSR
ncbi:FRG domain-containing protein [Brachybacterium halotolerans subsp. kimchii]|uniref:FRG domain-containing protein n=1 Tax=Brachybacterium halotolerans TaxID=2795215 RepID=UPI001E53C850|nr:FRG domain-containing protein [Brachybacterium halotolerans]UEJ81986.1 FRG domain-containing protein [Brachybacterium halotolerans subsp. kimchii]